jgi:hypothetical protein
MSDNDLIRRGDAIALFDAPNILEDLRAIPAADPLADPRVQALVEALKHMVNHAILDEQNEGVFWEAVPLARGAIAAFKGDEA